MNSRRKFLIQGSLATTAMLALKPFNSIAGAGSPLTWFSNSSGKLVFLHTANFHVHSDNKVMQHMASIKNNNSNAILLYAGNDVQQDESPRLNYDVCATNEEYQIIRKGNIRTGIISIKPGESDIVQKINNLSAYLKKEKNCAVVVCLSQLGYQNSNSPDDKTLAKESTHLDIIIGGHTENFHKHPVIALNKNNGEVIIHSASGDPAGFGSIEFEFDRQGKKKSLSLNNHSIAGSNSK